MSQMLSIYHELLKKHGQRQTDGRRPSFARWWPMSGRFHPPQFEICIGAILTQNTNWKNVEKALENLANAKALTAEAIANMPLPRLQKLVRPSGFFRQKAKRLKEFCKFVVDSSGDFYKDATREQLLKIKGIGRETADSILLYACNRPVFVVDAYTRRLFARLGLIDGSEGYDELKILVESALPKDAALYKEFHALIVQNEKKLRKGKGIKALQA